MTDISWKLPEGRFNFRAAAVIQSGGKVLAAHDEGSSYCYLPGGRVGLHEDTRTALERELAEELQEPCRVGSLLWVHENFFVLEEEGERFHELCFYYQAALAPDSVLLDREEFTTSEGDKTNGFRWIDLAAPGQNLLYPGFLAEKLASLESGTGLAAPGIAWHVVTR